MRRRILVIIVVGCALLVSGVAVLAQGPIPQGVSNTLGTGFTYQGQLKQNNTAFTGSCDLQYGLFDSILGGSQVGVYQTVSNVAVSNGLFTTLVNSGGEFGPSAFNGDARWLEILVRCPSGSGSFQLLSPREALTAVPYALRALSVTIQASDLPAGSGNYVQNTTASQSNANFNIAGSGTLGGDLNLPTTMSSTVGVLNVGGNHFLHNFGGGNTFLGLFAGNFGMTSTAQVNTGIGYYALNSNLSGLGNTALGFFALANNNSGSNSTALGQGALQSSNSGSDNTGVGSGALLNLMGGSENIALGPAAGIHYSGTESSNIVIGAAGETGDFDTIRIGSTQTKTVVVGIRGVTTAKNDAIPVVIDSAGQLGTTSSSRRFKDHIADMGQTSEVLYRLRPVTFQYKPEYGGGPTHPQVGLIAEEVAQIAPWLVAYGDDGQPYTVHYEYLAPMLLNEVQKQQQTIHAQSGEIDQLSAKVSTLEEHNASLEQRVSALERAMKSNGTPVRAEAEGEPTTWLLFGGLVVLGLVAIRRRQ